MKKYADKTGNSGVDSYAIFPDSIKVKFKYSDAAYDYSYSSAGKTHIEKMKTLAEKGAGLSTYISQNVSGDYEK